MFIRGFWTNARNPKVALFFLACLTQFIAPGAANKTLRFALPGLPFNLNALPINIGYGLGAAWVSGYADEDLRAAADRVLCKIDAVLPQRLRPGLKAEASKSWPSATIRRPVRRCVLRRHEN